MPSLGLSCAQAAPQLVRSCPAVAAPLRLKIVPVQIHTPDSSRYWIAESYAERHAAGREPQSIDKEFLRLWFRDHCDPYRDEVTARRQGDCRQAALEGRHQQRVHATVTRESYLRLATPNIAWLTTACAPDQQLQNLCLCCECVVRRLQDSGCISNEHTLCRPCRQRCEPLQVLCADDISRPRLWHAVQVLPEAPADLISELSRRYILLYETITGETFQPAPMDVSPAERMRTNVARALERL